MAAKVIAEQFDGSKKMIELYNIKDRSQKFPNGKTGLLYLLNSPVGGESIGSLHIGDWIVINDQGDYNIVSDKTFLRAFKLLCLRNNGN